MLEPYYEFELETSYEFYQFLMGIWTWTMKWNFTCGCNRRWQRYKSIWLLRESSCRWSTILHHLRNLQRKPWWRWLRDLHVCIHRWVPNPRCRCWSWVNLRILYTSIWVIHALHQQYVVNMHARENVYKEEKIMKVSRKEQNSHRLIYYLWRIWISTKAIQQQEPKPIVRTFKVTWHILLRMTFIHTFIHT